MEFLPQSDEPQREFFPQSNEPQQEILSQSEKPQSIRHPLPEPNDNLEDDNDDEGGLEEEDEDEHEETLCGVCGDNYASNQFWIFCDICEKWFHGKCVKITPAMADRMKQFKCPACVCSNKIAQLQLNH